MLTSSVSIVASIKSYNLDTDILSISFITLLILFNEYFSLAEIETPETSTIPEQFKKKGYKTISIGKIFHTGGDNENAWSSPPFRLDHFKKENGDWSDNGWFNYLNKENITLSDSLNGRVTLPWEIYKGKDSIYFD